MRVPLGNMNIFQESKYEIAREQSILGGEECNVPIQIVAQQDNSMNPTSSLGWMDTFGVLIRKIINDVQTLEWNKYLIMELIK